MKIQTSDPDIATVYGRIKEGYIDLQPDFQRDLVWNIVKKQTLIDTILRGWHFPPIFVVSPPSGTRVDVLDGQQRLNAIYEFMNDAFPINGFIEPMQADLRELDGLLYSQLPAEARYKFCRYSFRISELYDYREEEPYELFFRLNQGSVLTSAEKRNTLYGPTREYVKNLAMRMQKHGLNIDKIGFNNNRLAYEDVIARLLFALATRSLSKKITDQLLVDMYRSGTLITAHIYEQAQSAIDKLGFIISRKVKLSKPTLFTWLLCLSFEDIEIPYFYLFEELRKEQYIPNPELALFMDIFQERTSTSVNDVMAVQLRLLSIYMVGILSGQKFISSVGEKAHRIARIFLCGAEKTEGFLIQCMHAEKWGEL